MSEPLQLRPAPPEVEAVLLWAESYQGEHADPTDSTEYDNAADIIAALNRYLVELEMSERRAALEALLRQVGEAAAKWAAAATRALSEAMRPVIEVARKWADELIAGQRQRAIELLDSLQPYFDECERKKEIRARRREAFTDAARRFDLAHDWQRREARLRSQARIQPRRMTRTGIRQIIRR